MEIFRNRALREELLRVARGEKRAEFVIKDANVVNVCSGEIHEADIAIHKGIIVGVGRYRGIKEEDVRGNFAVPGLIDGHTHIEMSMLSVSEFARVVVPRGTTAVVADPHEIANVLGVAGIEAMLEEAKTTPLKVFFTVPSCVPSTPLETAGASIGASGVENLLRCEEFVGLAEVMDFDAVLRGDPEIFAKIEAAVKSGKAVDGHAPLLSGCELNAYILSGAGSDHESISAEEAREKLGLGMRVMVREGSAAKNLRAIAPVLKECDTRNCMLVTDGDRTPKDLLSQGHMDFLLRRAIEEGIDPVKAVQLCTINPATWFNLREIGSITPGKIADIIIVRNLERFEVLKVFVNGREISREFRKKGKFKYPKHGKSVNAPHVSAEDFILEEEKACRLAGKRRKARVIRLIENEIVTEAKIEEIIGIEAPKILKAAVVERHHRTGNIGIGFVEGFGLNSGAIASTIAHDSHNIVVIGTNERDMALACNSLSEIGGGIVLCDSGFVVSEIPLPIAGLMSDESVERVLERCERLEAELRKRGCSLDAIYTLSFIALPVIPSLRITDKGLVDVERGEVVQVFL